jgi:hypothetical protein
MLLVAATGFIILAVASVLSQAGVREPQFASTTHVDTFTLMATAKDLPSEIIDQLY